MLENWVSGIHVETKLAIQQFRQLFPFYYADVKKLVFILFVQIYGFDFVLIFLAFQNVVGTLDGLHQTGYHASLLK